MNIKLKIGKIPYANLYPIFYALQRLRTASEYEYVEGVPSDLNKQIRSGLIDISPSSSIEYLKHPDKYRLIDNHSISATGPVRSILLFSKSPLESLDGETVLTTSQSETSVVLLGIILKKFYRIECILKASSDHIANGLKSHKAYMLIGDEALSKTGVQSGISVYDLGELWYRNTGLPFTYALWIARKDCCKGNNNIIAAFKDDLDTAKRTAMENLDTIAAGSPYTTILSVEELVAYWKGISYDFTDLHKDGFALFQKYAQELGYL